ncbi:MAG: hypothetical protein EOO00_06695, partial [Chitinophagaceae bacterium]
MNSSIHRRKAPMLSLLLLFLCASIVVTGNAQDNFKLIKLRCNNADNPVGIDATTPQFSWEFTTATRNFRQAAYQVIVSDSPEQLEKMQGNIWNSGKVVSPQSSGILYKGTPLQSRKKYYWKVKTWSADNKEAVSEQAAHFEMGLLQ